MKSFINVFYKDWYRERIGHILFSNEVLLLFNDWPAITNKALYLVKRNIDEETVVGQEVGNSNQRITILYLKQRVLTQNGIPIKAKDVDLKNVQCNPLFAKEGFRQGDIYSFKEIGYLGNVNDDEKVELVTDQLVIFRAISSGCLYCYTYDELRALKRCGKIQVLC